MRGLKQSKSSIQNLFSIGAEVASVLPSYWFGKKPFPKHRNVSDYVEWVGFSRFAPLIDASWNKGDGDWNTFNRVLKGKAVWKRWEKLQTGEPPNEKEAKQITVVGYLEYIKMLRRLKDAMPWDSTVTISPLYKTKPDPNTKGKRITVLCGFPQVTLKKPSDCDKEIKEIEKLLSAFYDEIDKRFRK